MKGLVRGGTGAGSLETTELKSVTAGIQWRGRWDVVGFGGDKGKLEIQVIKDAMVDCGEVLEFELGVRNLSRSTTSSSGSKGRSRMSAIL